ncbi:MAG: acetyl-CoA C-acyltransferase, partial [Candidatus Aminicenantes bacterium]|nr:acetyl-CoA C-acyltransferase [Candidatus Aminicenantes bacterium]
MKQLSEKVVILSAVRTPIGKYGGAFKETSAVSLGVSASVEAMKRAAISPDQVDEVIFG